MFFDTPIYFIALTLVVAIYWRLSHRYQNRFLLAFSYLFYGWWDWRFLGLIAASTVVDYYCARLIDSSASERRRKLALIASLVSNIGFLGFFKYFNFFSDSLHVALLSVGVDVSQRTLDILLPPGISFYTFQAIAYIVDVHARKLPATRNLLDYALFISFFPHLIAGPIQQPSHLLPQIQEPRKHNPDIFANGLMLILTGLFRKCVVADQCALLANAAFSGGFGPPSVGVVAVGAYAFAWQIYGDFSGYSNIARGSAQLLGFHFMVNFRQPYLSVSIQDFWRRWHISLSTWLRDYLYIPLGGNRAGKLKTRHNLLMTMLIGGLWHGANWTYVVWGLLHGLWLAAFRSSVSTDADQPPSRLVIWLKRVVVFHAICLTWIVFRAPSLGDAWVFIQGLGSMGSPQNLGAAFVMLAMFSLPLLLMDILEDARGEEFLGERSSVAVQLVLASVLLSSILLFAANAQSAFIYFQF
jgi:alginate O-acetyltransferase complex protein AlgI